MEKVLEELGKALEEIEAKDAWEKALAAKTAPGNEFLAPLIDTLVQRRLALLK